MLSPPPREGVKTNMELAIVALLLMGVWLLLHALVGGR